MIFTFIDEERGNHHVSVLCKVISVIRAEYYAWKKRTTSVHNMRDAELLDRIRKIHADPRGTYGSPRVYAMLKREGIHTSRRLIERLMREACIKGISRSVRRQTGCKIAQREDNTQNLVKRVFRADGPNQIWFADITYVKTREGWLYLAVVFDIFSRIVVGWSMGNNMDAALVDDALTMGGGNEKKASIGTCSHSDHGSQYGSLLLGRTMRRYGIVPSMGTILSPWDNAITESLMSTIKTECAHRHTFKTRDEARLEIFDYIEVFHNKLRIHSAIGNLSPTEYEDMMCREPVPA